MEKYLVNTKNMSLYEKISWVIGAVPNILLDISEECSEDVFIGVPQVCEFLI